MAATSYKQPHTAMVSSHDVRRYRPDTITPCHDLVIQNMEVKCLPGVQQLQDVASSCKGLCSLNIRSAYLGFHSLGIFPLMAVRFLLRNLIVLEPEQCLLLSLTMPPSAACKHPLLSTGPGRRVPAVREGGRGGGGDTMPGRGPDCCAAE